MTEYVGHIVAEIKDRIRSHIASKDESAVVAVPLKAGRTTVHFCDVPVFRIRVLKMSTRIEVKSEFASDFGLEGFTSPMRESGWEQAEFSLSLMETMIANAPRVYEKCAITERIGCCSQYLECSDALKCIKPDQPWARGCMYRENLSKGKVFYGKNRNV